MFSRPGIFGMSSQLASEYTRALRVVKLEWKASIAIIWNSAAFVAIRGRVCAVGIAIARRGTIT
jgi:hypothetical protein